VQNLAAIVERAAARRPFVRHRHGRLGVTDATLRVFERVYALYRNVGPCCRRT